MEESKRLITNWVRIKHWLSENFPETLENLYSPAFESQIEAAETAIGMRFPEALRTLLLEHNGEERHWPPGIFPDGHRFLPTEDIVETWYKLHEFNDATPEHWLPISASRFKSIRFLDFNPPQGGHPGQVVEVNFDAQSYDVLADSFGDYIERYAVDLSVNKYAVIGDDILLAATALAEGRVNNDLPLGGFFAADLDEEEAEPVMSEVDFMDDEFFELELPDPDFEDDEADVACPVKTTLDVAASRVAKPVTTAAQRQVPADMPAYSPAKPARRAATAAAPQALELNSAATAEDEPANEAAFGELDVEIDAEMDQVPVLDSAVQPIARKPAPAKPKTTPKAAPKTAAAKPATARKAVPQQARRPVAVQTERPVQPAPAPAPDRLESGERLIIVGEMTSLMGKEEMLFTVETDQAKEYTFLAKASFTKGFSDIGLDQYVRVLAKKFHGEIKSHFIDQGLAKQPEYVAFDYVVLPVEKPSVNKEPMAPPANLDQIAHSILRAIQTNFQRGTDYKELTAEQSAALRTKFYMENTEKLLKLGFHYTADLTDQAAANSTQGTPAYMRVMSFFDDGIVGSFYHHKPRFSWPFGGARKVMEFETELSDGNIIISTTAEEEFDYPLPKTIQRYVHPAGIPIEGLLHKHRAKIRRYQTRKPDAAIVKVRSKKEFVALRQRRQQLICNHLKSVGWVTKEYVVKQFNNKEVAEQVYARIKQFAGTKV